MNIKALFKRPIHTFCDMEGEELDVVVDADYQPDESDVNVGASVDITDVRNTRGESVLARMSEEEVEQLRDRIFYMAVGGDRDDF